MAKPPLTTKQLDFEWHFNASMQDDIIPHVAAQENDISLLSMLRGNLNSDGRIFVL